MIDELPTNVKKSISEIKKDNTSGSVELAKKSAEILLNLISHDISADEIKKACYLLVKAQPSMALIFNFSNNLFFKIDENKNLDEKKLVSDYCKEFLDELKKSDENISKNLSEIIKNNSTIVTHSYSSTVLNALLYAKKSGKRFSVVCTESRPKNEGVKLAKILGENKIKVKLIVDSAVFSFIKDSNLIIVGGDAVTDSDLLNKIGTKGIVITAKGNDVPVYALCSSMKFLPSNILKKESEKNPSEITKYELANVKPVNYYFEKTPLKYFNKIISEKEILDSSKVKDIVKNLKVHEDLKKLI